MYMYIYYVYTNKNTHMYMYMYIHIKAYPDGLVLQEPARHLLALRLDEVLVVPARFVYIYIDVYMIGEFLIIYIYKHRPAYVSQTSIRGPTDQRININTYRRRSLALPYVSVERRMKLVTSGGSCSVCFICIHIPRQYVDIHTRTAQHIPNTTA